MTVRLPQMSPVGAPAYEWEASLRRRVDADTLDLQVDLGFETLVVPRVRLFACDAPEVTGATRQQGLEASAFVQGWFDAQQGKVRIRSHKARLKEKYGRWLVEVWSADNQECLNLRLLELGLAKPLSYR